MLGGEQIIQLTVAPETETNYCGLFALTNMGNIYYKPFKAKTIDSWYKVELP